MANLQRSAAVSSIGGTKSAASVCERSPNSVGFQARAELSKAPTARAGRERPMPEQKESSVLFSLKELMNLEEDRIRQEESARKAKQEAELQARLDAERRQREEEEARLQGETNRRRAEEQRVREEQARVEAIRHAEVEKARLDAENAARIEAMRHQQEHERHLQSIKQDKHKRNLLIAAVGAALLLVFGAVGFVMVVNKNNRERE